MKEKLTKNLGMKILSFAIALISWVAIVNIDDPVITRTFPGISVDIIHEEAINSLNQVYEVVEGDVVNITVKGKKSIIDSLNTSDFRAEADLNKLSSVNAVPIRPYITKTFDGDVEISLGKVDTLRVSLEDVEEKQFQVTVVQKGNVQDGYSIGEIKVKPNLIKVSGAKSQISRITEVRVDLDVSSASEPISQSLEPKVYDSNGYIIDSSNMKFSSSRILVTADLLNTKTVPLLIDVTGDPASGYQYVNIDYEPKKITIAGKQKKISSIKYIAIKLDISNANENIEEEVNLSDYIPDGTKIADKNTTAMVNIKIAKLSTKIITFGLNDLEVKNIPEDMTFSYKTVSNLSIEVKGTEDELSSITIDNLNPYIDLSKINKGTHSVVVQFNTTKEINIISRLTIQIQLLLENELKTGDETKNDATETSKPSTDIDSTKDNNSGDEKKDNETTNDESNTSEDQENETDNTPTVSPTPTSDNSDSNNLE